MIKVIFIALVAGAFAADKNIVQLATELGATTLVQFLQDAGLDTALAGQGPFTVFAPTNTAFAALPASVVDALKKDPALLKKVLMFHAADGATRSSQLSDNMLVTSLDTSLKIRVNIYTKQSATIVTVDGAKVVMADQMASNGVIHVIDHVMFPLPASNIPATAAVNSKLTTLLYAVAQAQLAGPLSADGPLTLFAPNNAAFDKLPVGYLSDLLSNQTALIAVLEYHVVKGAAYSAGLSSGMVKTLEGKPVNVVVSKGGVMVNNAKVVTADIPTSNGVIHEIDMVLLP